VIIEPGVRREKTNGKTRKSEKANKKRKS